MATCKDFATSSLNGEGKKIASVIKRIVGKNASGGGCKAFYTPQQWEDKGLSHILYGCDSALVVCHDGGDLAPYFNDAYEQYHLIDKMVKALEEIGYYYSGCTCWYSAIYKL